MLVPAHSSERENLDSEGAASEPKLRGSLAEDVMRDLFHEQKSLVT